MKSTEKVLLSFAVGVGLGAVLGVLLAPSKGSETRQRIKDGVDKCCSKVSDIVDEFKGMVAKGEQQEQYPDSDTIESEA